MGDGMCHKVNGKCDVMPRMCRESPGPDACEDSASCRIDEDGSHCVAKNKAESGIESGVRGRGKRKGRGNGKKKRKNGRGRTRGRGNGGQKEFDHGHYDDYEDPENPFNYCPKQSGSKCSPEESDGMCHEVNGKCEVMPRMCSEAPGPEACMLSNTCQLDENESHCVEKRQIPEFQVGEYYEYGEDHGDDYSDPENPFNYCPKQSGSKCTPDNTDGMCHKVNGKCDVMPRMCKEAPGPDACDHSNSCKLDEDGSHCAAKKKAESGVGASNAAGETGSFILLFGVCALAFGGGYYYNQKKQAPVYTKLNEGMA